MITKKTKVFIFSLFLFSFFIGFYCINVNTRSRIAQAKIAFAKIPQLLVSNINLEIKKETAQSIFMERGTLWLKNMHVLQVKEKEDDSRLLKCGAIGNY